MARAPEMSAPPDIVVGCRLSRRLWSVAKLLEFLVEDGNSIVSIDAVGMGRGAVKAEVQALELSALHRAWTSITSTGGYERVAAPRNDRASMSRGFGRVVGRTKVDANTTAKSVEASRLSFGPPSRFNPVSLFHARTAVMTCRWWPLLLVSELLLMTIKLLLFKKLAETGRLVPLDSEVDEAQLSGLFCVPKDLEHG